MPLPVLVFDMDGVLVDVTESYRETIRQTVKYFTGQEIDNARIQDLKNAGGWTNDWDVTHRIIQDLGVKAEYLEVVALFQSLFLGDDEEEGLMRREKWVAQSGLLERLSRSYRLAVFTGRPAEEARMTLDRFAAGLAFDPVIGAEDVENGKPAPDGLQEIVFRTHARKVWYIGDTVDDARSALAAGVPFIGVAADTTPRREELVALFKDEGAAAVINDINQLEGVL
jgi:HAD superfamily hydrolase (TIGR01548 family)